jgi:hypothetical protein
MTYTNFLLFFAALALSACGGKKAANETNFKESIQAYLETQKACITIKSTFPITLSMSNMALAKYINTLEALKEIGMLSSKEIKKDSWMFGRIMGKERALQYSITDMGARFITIDTSAQPFSKICYGAYTVSSIIDFTKPLDTGEKTLSDVTYMRNTVVEPWVKNSTNLQKYNDAIMDDVNHPQKQKTITLVLTDGMWTRYNQ